MFWDWANVNDFMPGKQSGKIVVYSSCIKYATIIHTNDWGDGKITYKGQNGNITHWCKIEYPE